MNAQTPAGKTISVLTVGMDSRKQAIFRMAFKTHTLQRYQLVEDAPGSTPDIAIVDMDCADARTLWAKFRSAHPRLPAIIATASPAPDAPAPVLAKPVRMETLFPLLRQTLVGGVPLTEHTVPLATARVTPAAAPFPTPTPMHPSAAKPAKPHQQLPETITHFDPEEGLLGVLQGIRRQRTPSVISIAGEAAAIVLPNQDNALLLKPLGNIRQACGGPADSILVRPLSSSDRPRGAASHSFTALLWQVALWTSRGRLVEGVHPQTPVRLRHWPNLTRMAPIPEAMRIAALWVRAPVNLRLTVRMLDVAPQHIFDFLAASHSIGLLELHESPAELVTSSPPREEPVSSVEPEKGGLLSRLLRRVAGL